MSLLLQNVSFSYGEKQVLRDLSLSVEAGERVALMGASGEGKTTLLRLLAGLEKPSCGTIACLPPRGVSMVFQENRLLPGLTALDNLRIAAPKSDTASLLALLDELGLAGEAHSYPDALSGGMKRRVAIARAAAFARPLFLLDEPFTGLDAENSARAAAFLLRHLPADGSLIAVTHDRREATLLNARIVTLGDIEK